MASGDEESPWRPALPRLTATMALMRCSVMVALTV